MPDSIVLLSGGQDSTTCLAWAAKELGGDIRTLAFDYGQRHSVELRQANVISAFFPEVVSHVVLPVSALRDLSSAALTNPDIEVEGTASPTSGNVHAASRNLPSTFVPGRNMLFLTLAAAYGAKYGIYDLVTGVCEQDFSGYPDCRETFIVAAQNALQLALDEPSLTIHTPLIHMNKADTWKMAKELDILDLVVKATHTCYKGDRHQLHPWGYGCDNCGACAERKKGFEQAFS